MITADTLPEALSRAAAEAGVSDAAASAQLVGETIAAQGSPVTAVLDAGGLDEIRFLHSLADQLGMPWMGDRIQPIQGPLREQFPARVALRHHLMPAQYEENGPLWILTYDPFNTLARQVVSQTCPPGILWGIAGRRQILDSLRQGYGVGAETFEELLAGRIDPDAALDIKQETTVLDMEDSEASVVKFVNQIIREALNERATDIHVEPLDHDLRIRYRIDGVLHETPVPPQIKLLQASVISRLKIMAHLDIAERRLPQDGRINLEFEGRPIDVRVAVIPSVSGESVSLRLLGQQRFDFSMLGLDPDVEVRIRALLAMPNGIVLLTGPTGCGKSTTLYTFLSSLNTRERRIVTIEDPVEQKLEGVIQIAVRPEINLTFAAGLRSILRGDPNVVMVGEMRDFETGEIAIRAALTGHLVFSTLHTNDAIGGITRLMDMGIEPFLVASAVRAFLAQRLVRVLCPTCKTPATHPDAYLRRIGFPVDQSNRIFKAAGCEQCRFTGYRGRRALLELCVVTPHMQDLITSRQSGTALRATALAEGMVTLRQDGWAKVISGSTSLEEVVRVTTAEVEMQDE